MRKYIYAIFVLTTICFSCKPNKQVQESSHSSQKPILFVSVQPLKYFVDQIVKDRFEVKVLVPPGSSPETFAPSSKQIASLEQAVALFKIGALGFEERWDNNWQKEHPQTELINCSIGMPSLCLHHHHGDHHHHGTDPHIWLAPQTAKIIAHNIYEGILRFDPANKQFYHRNLKHLLDTIAEVKTALDQKLNHKEEQEFLIFHPVLGYLSKYYHLHQESIEFEGKKPTLKQLKHIVEIAKEENISTILVQKEFNTSNAEIIAKEINGKVITIDPLGYDWPKVMIEIGDAIVAE